MALIILGHPNYEKSVANRTIVDELQQSGLDIEARHIELLYPDYRIDAACNFETVV